MRWLVLLLLGVGRLVGLAGEKCCWQFLFCFRGIFVVREGTELVIMVRSQASGRPTTLPYYLRNLRKYFVKKKNGKISGLLLYEQGIVVLYCCCTRRSTLEFTYHFGDRIFNADYTRCSLRGSVGFFCFFSGCRVRAPVDSEFVQCW